MADVSCWMRKPVGPNSSSKYQLCCEKTISDKVEFLYCTALTCATFQELELVQDHNFFFPCQDLSVPLEPSGTNETQSLMLANRCVAVAARESVSQAATPAIRAICAALSALMFPLAPLKVADITGRLGDISRR